jgi:hypothetical protein
MKDTFSSATVGFYWIVEASANRQERAPKACFRYRLKTTLFQYALSDGGLFADEVLATAPL